MYDSRKINHGWEGTDIIACDAETGKRKVLISAPVSVQSEKSTPLRIEGYSWSKDGKLPLVFTNSRRGWRLNTRDIYRVFEGVEKNLKKMYSDN